MPKNLIALLADTKSLRPGERLFKQSLLSTVSGKPVYSNGRSVYSLSNKERTYRMGPVGQERPYVFA